MVSSQIQSLEPVDALLLSKPCFFSPRRVQYWISLVSFSQPQICRTRNLYQVHHEATNPSSRDPSILLHTSLQHICPFRLVSSPSICRQYPTPLAADPCFETQFQPGFSHVSSLPTDSSYSLLHAIFLVQPPFFLSPIRLRHARIAYATLQNDKRLQVLSSDRLQPYVSMSGLCTPPLQKSFPGNNRVPTFEHPLRIQRLSFPAVPPLLFSVAP
mmetsp:Transcript_92364/g.146027  ORF Transcript_92364/g.146027 Transcript_92364/m.146027 type:complete len:214 (-) Transcript_92364:540-1181(-)